MLQINFYNYSSKKLAKNRELYSLKCCYRSHLNFLRLRSNITKGISNSIVNYANHYNSYKLLNKFYILYLRDNFTAKIHCGNLRFKSRDVAFFANSYKQYTGLKDLNRAFIWRALQLSPIFKAKLSLIRGKNRRYYNNIDIYFIKPKYRILIVWSWVKYLLKCFSSRKYLEQLQLGMENFLGASEANNVVTGIKMQVYRIQLIRSL